MALSPVRMRRGTILPPSGMTPPADWESWRGDSGAIDEGGRAFWEGNVNSRGVPTCSCPICGLDLTTWTIPDRETHADGCVAAVGNDTSMTAHDGLTITYDGRVDGGVAMDKTSAPNGLRDCLHVSCETKTSCASWLASIGLSSYTSSFTRESLFLTDLASLTRGDLKNVLGMSDGDVDVFLEAIGGMQSTRTTSRGRTSVDQNQTQNDSKDSSHLTCDERHTESLQQHDDECLTLRMAISESVRDVRAANAAGSLQTNGNDAPRRADARPENQESEPQNKRTETRAEFPKQSSPKDPDDLSDDVDFVAERSALAAARVFRRRSAPSTLWAAAGHGGKDRTIPKWVFGRTPDTG